MARARRPRPILRHLTIALTLSVAATVGIWYAALHRWAWLSWVAAWLIAVNFVTFFYYGYDKWMARSKRRRVPEVALHTLAVVGGSLGAWVGMNWFRHKIVKEGFRYLFWAIVVLQLGLLGWVAYHNLRHS